MHDHEWKFHKIWNEEYKKNVDILRGRKMNFTPDVRTNQKQKKTNLSMSLLKK